MVHDVKKHFYKKFLYEPFPVESSLLSVLPDHLNAEIVASTIGTKQEAMDYLTWTYFFRRLLINPTYYELESIDANNVNKYLSDLIQKCLYELESSSCIEIGENGELNCTTGGRIASFYYLSNLTLKMFKDALNDDVDIESLIDIVSNVSLNIFGKFKCNHNMFYLNFKATEFSQLPVRHNEDKLNAELSNDVPLKVNQFLIDSPHTKCNLLLQAHFSRVQLPISDYITDTKSVLDQCLRIMQAMLDYCADQGWCKASLAIINLMQMSCQGRWLTDSDLISMPHIEPEHLTRFFNHKPRIDCLPRLIEICDKSNYQDILENLVGDLFDRNQLNDLYRTISILPQIELRMSLSGELPNKQAKNELLDGFDESKVYNLLEDEEYTISLDINRLNKSKRYQDGKAYAPKYPKPKDESWIIILGNTETSELVGLKRLTSLRNKQIIHVQFKTPTLKDMQNNEYKLALFFMSDVYLGLDQQFDFRFRINQKK